MKYFFDESGRFTVKNPGPHNMVGIAFPEVFERELRQFYVEFTASLISKEFKNGEPKGYLLLPKSREKLFTFLNKNSWLQISVCLTDSEFNSEYQVQQYRKEQLAIYKNQLLDPVFKNQPKEKIDLQKALIKDVDINGGLSDVHFIKGLLLMHTLFTLLVGSFNYYSAEIYDENWENLFLCFDRQDKNIITKMENWVNKEFMNLITDYSSNNKPILPSEWFNRNHPILRDYKMDGENALDLNKMFEDKFNYEDSQSYYQLQIVDWISNTLYFVFKSELSQKFINEISDNLVKQSNANFHLACFGNTDNSALLNKYRNFLE